MIYDWKLLNRSSIFQKSFINVYEDHYNNGIDSKNRAFYIIDMPDWVNIIAVTDEKKLILIRQYRFGTRDFQIEIPGGAVDRTDSLPIQSAQRELIEETGYGGGEWQQIGSILPNPAIQSNKCFTYLAKGIRLLKEPSFDDNEDIETVLTGIDEAYDMVYNGIIKHSLVICALMFAKKYIL